MFFKARLKLTSWYLLIIMIISFSFSVVIHQVLMREVDRFERQQRIRIERRLEENFFPSPDSSFRPPPLADPELLEETKHRIDITLIVINGAIFLIAGGCGYFLAGRTLKPIADMIDDQNRFISDASHELRTPLTAMKSTLEVNLRDKNLKIKDARNIMSENIEEVDKLQSLSDNLLKVIQYHKPNQKIPFEKLSIKKIIEDVIKKIKPLGDKKHIDFKNNLEDYIVSGNQYSISELFTILIDNAIKYSPPNKHIYIKSQKIDGKIMVSVEDEGIGIDEKDIPNIFNRFFRADSARSHDGAYGYGLGLSIAKEIVDLHKGSIEVKSKLKSGTTFIVYLPIHQSGISSA